jgi:hypothetical protein
MEARVTSFQSERNLAIVQLVTSDQDSFEYVPCGRAIAANMIEVKELGDSGSVNTIFVVNNSGNFIFLMDGDILAGAKQNRVVNTSILLAPHSKTKIPVSCVEQGRWKHSSPTFTDSPAAAPIFLRADKARQVKDSLKRGAGFASDQARVWDGVASFQHAHNVQSPTSCLSDVFEKKGFDIDQQLKRFLLDPGSNGIAVFFGKHLAGIDIFNRRSVLQEYFPKILMGAAMEANAHTPSPNPLSEAEGRFRTLDLLDSIEKLNFDEQPGVGVGLDRRFESKEVHGFELEYNKHLIHLAAFVIKTT